MFDWRPYVSAAERRRKAARRAASLSKKGRTLSPMTASRGAIARTFWGKSWCDNLESYSDYSNRLPRGRTYCRNGSVIDLQVKAGAVTAEVMGSSLYQVSMKIADVPKTHWLAIGKECSGSIDSLVELLQGRLSQSVMERICRKGAGLFPSPREMHFECSCPDWAAMCKHIAAVCYGIGARLDAQPELLFLLRNVDPKELVARAAAETPLLSRKSPKSAKVLDASKLADVFGIEMAQWDAAPAKKPRSKTKAAKKPPKAKTKAKAKAKAKARTAAKKAP